VQLSQLPMSLLPPPMSSFVHAGLEVQLTPLHPGEPLQ
jgi:hypothetical protein